MKSVLLLASLLIVNIPRVNAWGYYAHKLINRHAVFLLPPAMLALYKPNILFLTEHSVDPDKRRYVLDAEGPRHYIDVDKYDRAWLSEGNINWQRAVKKYSVDTLMKHGIVPWWIQVTLHRLTAAFAEKNTMRILKLSADLGHYISDAHVPLHACSNHNGQFTNQQGIHGFWESRIPELLAEKEWDFLMTKAKYIKKPLEFTWRRLFESAAAADSVLSLERKLSARFPEHSKYAFEDRNGVLTRQYSSAYTTAYNELLDGMVERRCMQAIEAVASLWYTAWVNAGQPDCAKMAKAEMTESEQREIDELHNKWKTGNARGKSCE